MSRALAIAFVLITSFCWGSAWWTQPEAPPTCSLGDWWYDTDAPANQAFQICIANGWTASGRTIQDELVDLPYRTFVNMTGPGASCVDNPGAERTDCTFSGGAGGDPTLVGDVDGLGSANDLDELSVEVELEGVLDLQDLQGAVTDTQVPNSITIDLATLATTAGTANAGDSATGFFASGTLEDALINGASEADEVNPTLGTQTQGNYVGNVADGTGVDGTVANEGGTYTPTLDLTEITCSPPLSCSEATTLTTSMATSRLIGRTTALTGVMEEIVVNPPLTLTGLALDIAAIADTDLVSNYSGVGACGANTWASILNDNVAPSCTQPSFTNLSGLLALAQITDDAASGKCLVSGGAGDPAWTTCPGGGDPTLVGDVDGLGSANDLDELSVETELEGVLDLQDQQGAVTDPQVPNNITVDLATLATTAGTANTGDSATGFFPSGTLEDARLSATVSLLGATIGGAELDNPAAGVKGGVSSLICSGTDKLSAINTSGLPVCSADQTAGGGPTTLTSTSNQSDAVIATYTAITGLSFTPAATTNYLIDCYIIYTSTASTTGINFAWDTPASPTAILMTGHTKTVATGANEGFSQNSDNVGTATSAAVITVQHLAYLNTLFRNGSTSATMSLGFTPETANSVSVIVGSVCQYRTY